MMVYSTICLMILIMYYEFYYSFIYKWLKLKKNWLLGKQELLLFWDRGSIRQVSIHPFGMESSDSREWLSKYVATMMDGGD